jgi:hypothetical protein
VTSSSELEVYIAAHRMGQVAKQEVYSAVRSEEREYLITRWNSEHEHANDLSISKSPFLNVDVWGSLSFTFNAEAVMFL